MNRRAFFSALAGAPVAVVSGTVIAATMPEKIAPSFDKSKSRDVMANPNFQCSCGSHLYHMKDSDYYSKDWTRVCAWCRKEFTA